MTKANILLFLIILLALLGAIIFWPKSIPSPNPTPTPTSTQPSQNPNSNIKVTDPKPNSQLTLPITTKGQARVFENQLNYRVRDVNKNIILEGRAYANSPDVGQFGNFEIIISSLPTMRANALTLEVFDYSAKDGAEIDTVSIPITYDPSNSIPVKAFFGSKQAPLGQECSSVYPVEHHVPKTQAIARAALEELLKGPLLSEKNNDFYTSINDGVKIQKLTIQNGVASVDFDKKLEEGVAGSCKVTAIKAQITQTLKQFPTVKEVTISIDNRTQDILQP